MNTTKAARTPVKRRATPWAAPIYLRDGPHYDEGLCLRCGKELIDAVALELDQRIGEYHDFGKVPADQSQGWFEFGQDCARVLRNRARAALAKVRP